MPKLSASEVAALLREFGRRIAFDSANPYRARAYAKAADNLERLGVPLATIIRRGRLREIPAVGEAIAGVVATLYQTGTHPTLEALREDIPDSVLGMAEIPELKPGTILKLHREFGISSVDALEEAAAHGDLAIIEGIGPSLQTKIVQGIESRRQANALYIDQAEELLDIALQSFEEAHAYAEQIVPAGDFRRGCELVSDLCLVAELPRLKQGSGISNSQGRAQIFLTDRKHFGASLLYATGSEAHFNTLVDLAATKGLSLDRRGLHKAGKSIASQTEADIYQALGLPYIEPELREGDREIELALNNKLPELVTDDDLRGILHAHTHSSDGAHSLEQMAEAVRRRGYSYFGVSDHSRSAHYARGLSIETIERQHEEIDRLNAAYNGGFRIFKGIESDILPDGSLDYPDEILAHFDFVVASVHSRFQLDEDAQTARMMKAVANPYTTILGHMTGRQLLRRPGYGIDIEKILRACAKHGVAVEINSNPLRLDLDWRWHARALALGCRFSIDPDAHSASEIAFAHWGVEMARKGGVSKDSVINCLDSAQFSALLEERKVRKPRTQAHRKQRTQMRNSGR